MITAEGRQRLMMTRASATSASLDTPLRLSKHIRADTLHVYVMNESPIGHVQMQGFELFAFSNLYLSYN
jgi:hypothetical protein